MRKHQQKQILELLQAINEAQSVGLYNDCQNAAISVVRFIKSIEGEDTQTVALLEEYCKLLVKACNGKIDKKHLQMHFTQIEYSVKSELQPNKIEIVFFPYKASMWDSLESIYLAAKDDLQCEAYVVPLPYYDRMSNGNFGKMHYEGNDYPDNIPITDWREYDVEARHPDVIFIHLPYDDGNRVTSIHPDFYSKRLKNCTDLLCYSPYFVSVSETSESFITTIAVLYADKVFLQSVRIKDRYIKVFEDFLKKNNCIDRFGRVKDKFVALGSPKFDAIINAKHKNYTLLNEWRKVLEKPDGTRKKVVLYNTSLGAILRNNEKHLKKLRSVLEFFRTCENVVLWWRPHPLSEATIDSMRPRLVNEYRQIVTDYKLAGYGIYDDTPDLNMAITFTDAYYGDGSSLIALYFCTMKPIMLQNIINRNCNDLIPLNMYKCGNQIYCTICGTTSLICLNTDTGKADCIIEGDLCGYTTYSSIVCLNNVLYLIPCYMPGILEYHIKEKTHSITTLSEDVCKLNSQYSAKEKFLKAFVYKNGIFMVGLSYPAIVEFKPDTGYLQYYTDWYKNYSETGTIIFYDACVVETKIVAVGMSQKVLFFDMELLSYEIFSVNTKVKGFTSISYDGKNYWLSPVNNGPIICWNPNSGETCEYNVYPKNLLRCDKMFGKSVFINNNLWLFPSDSNMVIKLNTVNGEMESVMDFGNTETGQNAHFFAELIDGLIYTASVNGNGLNVYNIEMNEYNNIRIDTKLNPGFDIVSAYDSHKTIQDTIIYEAGLCNLSMLVNRVINNNDHTSDIKQELVRQWISAADGTAGQAIYDYVKREI